MTTFLTRNMFDPVDPKGGFRLLLAREWPAGVHNEQIHADMWLKDLAPSTSLLEWYGQDQAKWNEFKTRYFSELNTQDEAVSKILAESKKAPITILSSASNPEYDPAVALAEYLTSHSNGGSS